MAWSYSLVLVMELRLSSCVCVDIHSICYCYDVSSNTYFFDQHQSQRYTFMSTYMYRSLHITQRVRVKPQALGIVRVTRTRNFLSGTSLPPLSVLTHVTED